MSFNSVYPNQQRIDIFLHGDFNGDEIQDLVLVPKSNTGSIRILYGSPSGLEFKDSVVLNEFYHVASSGDVQGDGFDDLLISIGNKIALYKGSSQGIIKDNSYTIDLNELLGIAGTDATGYAEKYADQNQDGKPEIIVTAGNSMDPGSPGGQLFVMQSNNEKFKVIKSYTGEEFDSFFNRPLKLSGDLNGDGYSDISIFRYYAVIEVFYGGPQYFSPNNKSIINEDFDDRPSFNNVGDVNKDGYNDFLVTMAQEKAFRNSAWLFLGSTNGISTASWSIEEGENKFYIFEGFGSNSGPVGDVNGDGYYDFYIAGGKLTNSLLFFGNADVNQIKPGGRFGINPHQLINAGDLNGDGKEDYASGYTDPINKSIVGIINGNATGMNIVSCPVSSQPIALTFDAKFGQGAGDVNKDGFADIVLGHDALDPSLLDEIGKIMVVTGAPVGTGSGGMEFVGGIFNYFGDQFGSGDFNGDGYSDVIAGAYTYESVFIFSGSENGIIEFPYKALKEEGIYGGWGESIEDIGDVNKDGFDDFLSLGFGGMKLVTGSSTGPIVSEWKYRSSIAFRAGDSNKDGFSDFFLKVPEGYRLFYGSSTGPVMSSFISSLPVILGGDINGDGFDDMLTSDNSNKSIGILFGNPTGYTEQKNVIQNVFNPNGIGDFNGDGYDDIGVSNTLDDEKFLGAPWRVDVYLGSASGIQQNIFNTFRGKKKYHNLIAQPRVGDFNKDGFEDLLLGAGFEVWLIYGVKGIPNISCLADRIVYSDSTCTTKLMGINPPGNPELYKYKVTGTSSFEGAGSLNGKYFGTGEYFVTYSLLNDDSRFCTFRINVLDTIPPKLITSNKIINCSKTSTQLYIPLLKINDMCQVKEIKYSIGGATYRSGTGLNASGIFNPGDSYITWTVTDSSNNTSTITLQVSNLNSEFNVKIPKAYQINPQQSQVNTIYLGYANNTLRLTAYEPNSSKHTYRWSNGDTTRFTRVTHNIPGRYKYSVFVSNESGCTDRADVFIKVIDNYCPNPLKDYITLYFPQLLNQPWIQALIASTSQMYLCYNGSTVCVNPAAVPAMISNGARFGKCGVIYEGNDMITAKEEENSVGELTLSASPNPSGHEFTLKIDGTKGKPYALRIVNSVGSPVFMKQDITENIVRAGGSFQKGVYFAEVICGNERKVIKLLKVR